jgi:hypothetical protein
MALQSMRKVVEYGYAEVAMQHSSDTLYAGQLIVDTTIGSTGKKMVKLTGDSFECEGVLELAYETRDLFTYRDAKNDGKPYMRFLL